MRTELIESFIRSHPTYTKRVLARADVNGDGYITEDELDALGDLKDSFQHFSKNKENTSTDAFYRFYVDYVEHILKLDPNYVPPDLRDNLANFERAHSQQMSEEEARNNLEISTQTLLQLLSATMVAE